MNEVINELVSIENNELKVNQEMVNQIIEFKKQEKEMTYKSKLLSDGLLKGMQMRGIKSFCGLGIAATVREGTTRTTLDSKRLKEECPDIYEAYSKTSEVKPSLVLTISE